jgi:prephenate dehydrogenase
MAGTEFSGPHAAVKNLYFYKTNIICEKDKTNLKIYKNALRIFKLLKMNIIYMEPEPHDVHIAYVSHLSHISSFMLGKTVIEKEKNEKNIFDLAGSGFESTVRLAKSSPETWTPIFLQNKKNLVKAIDEYVCNLNNLKLIIEKDNVSGLSLILNNTNRIKEILKKTNTENEK